MSVGEHKLTWSEETMQIINKLTPNIKEKAFDIEWFLLRQRFEEFEYKANQAAIELPAHCPKCGSAEIKDSQIPCNRTAVACEGCGETTVVNNGLKYMAQFFAAVRPESRKT